MNRRLLVFVLVLTLGVLLCSNVTILAKTNLNVLGIGMSYEASQLLIEAFESKHPDISVRMDVIPWDGYYAKMLSNIRAAQYDVYYIPQLLPITYNDAYLEPLEKYAEQEGPEFLQQFFPDVLAIGYRPDRKGQLHLYAIPFDADARYVMYDKSIFDAYGCEYLDPEGNYTIRDLKELALKMTGINPMTGEQTYGLALRANPMDYYFPTFIGSLGKDVFDYEFGSKEAYFESPEVTEVLETMVELVEAGAAGPEVLAAAGTPPQFTTDINPYAIVIGMGADTVLPEIAPRRDRIGIAALPKNPVTGKGGPAFFHGWAMDKRSRVKDAAWEWLKFGATDDAQMIVFQQQISGWPVVQRWYDWNVSHPIVSPDKDIPVNSIPELFVVHEQFMSSTPNLVDNWVKVRSVIREEIGNLLALEKTVEQVQADLQSRVVEAMNDPLWTW
ncbi:MAG: extracellular solute-binding protein [Firmicutes bacterium]|nr:extracellular solute-binding protein [Bacillota bacterium]NLY31154.1 extracellular solute-binding protein [Bacillota bacterium]